jgi:hypothetical protein
MLHLFTLAFYRKYGYLPDLEAIELNGRVLIYSDDKLGGINFEFFGITEESFPALEAEVYGLYGIVIKPSSVLITKVNGRVDPRHEFLGSFCHFDEATQRYIPYPRIGKICSSITRIGLNTDLSDVEHFMKTVQLTLLSFKDEVVFNVLCHYVRFLIARSNDDPEFYEILKDNDLLSISPYDVLSFHLGWESSYFLSSEEDMSLGTGFDFLPDALKALRGFLQSS